MSFLSRIPGDVLIECVLPFLSEDDACLIASHTTRGRISRVAQNVLAKGDWTWDDVTRAIMDEFRNGVYVWGSKSLVGVSQEDIYVAIRCFFDDPGRPHAVLRLSPAQFSVYVVIFSVIVILCEKPSSTL